MKILTDLQALEIRRNTMINYLNMKMGEEDWHGVQDAASDLREIDTTILIYTKLDLRKTDVPTGNTTLELKEQSQFSPGYLIPLDRKY